MYIHIYIYMLRGPIQGVVSGFIRNPSSHTHHTVPLRPLRVGTVMGI